MQLQVGTAELCLDVQAVALLPGCDEGQDVGVWSQALMVLRLPHAPRAFPTSPEAVHRALDRVLPTVSVTQHLGTVLLLSQITMCHSADFFIESNQK